MCGLCCAALCIHSVSSSIIGIGFRFGWILPLVLLPLYAKAPYKLQFCLYSTSLLSIQSFECSTNSFALLLEQQTSFVSVPISPSVCRPLFEFLNPSETLQSRPLLSSLPHPTRQSRHPSRPCQVSRQKHLFFDIIDTANSLSSERSGAASSTSHRLLSSLLPVPSHSPRGKPWLETLHRDGVHAQGQLNHSHNIRQRPRVYLVVLNGPPGPSTRQPPLRNPHPVSPTNHPTILLLAPTICPLSADVHVRKVKRKSVAGQRHTTTQLKWQATMTRYPKRTTVPSAVSVAMTTTQARRLWMTTRNKHSRTQSTSSHCCHLTLMMMWPGSLYSVMSVTSGNTVLVSAL